MERKICGAIQKNGNSCTAKCYFGLKTCRRHDEMKTCRRHYEIKPRCIYCGLILKNYLCPKTLGPEHQEKERKFLEKKRLENIAKFQEQKHQAEIKFQKNKCAFEEAMRKRIDMIFSNNFVPSPIKDVIVGYCRPDKFRNKHNEKLTNIKNE